MPFLIVAGYWIIAFTSENREVRFFFPGLIALPFLIGLLLPGKVTALPTRSAALAAMLFFCCLAMATVPMLHRANSQSAHRSEEVLDQALQSGAKRVLLATESSTLNQFSMRLAIAVSSTQPSMLADACPWVGESRPIQKIDFRMIRGSDLIVFQNKENLDFASPRIPQFEQYTPAARQRHSQSKRSKISICMKIILSVEPLAGEPQHAHPWSISGSWKVSVELCRRPFRFADDSSQKSAQRSPFSLSRLASVFRLRSIRS